VTDRALSIEALARALDALTIAAGELSVAAILAPPGTDLATDTDVLADAVEAEVAAVLTTVLGYG
jgi:hypothetical protein